MSIDPTVTRRALLVAGAAGTGTVVLAACSSGSSDDTASQRGSTATAAPGGNDSGNGSGTSGSDDSGSSGNSGTALATLDDIPVGQAISVKLPDGGAGIVARPTTSTAVAFSAICTHQGCTVAPKGKQLDCPCHGSVFEATTGKVLQGPAPSPLPSVKVEVTGGRVMTA